MIPAHFRGLIFASALVAFTAADAEDKATSMVLPSVHFQRDVAPDKPQ